MFLHVSVILCIEWGSAIHPRDHPHPKEQGTRQEVTSYPPAPKPQFLAVFLYVVHRALWVPPKYDVDLQFLH